MTVQLTRHRFTADEYQWMVRTGILREDDRVELIDGEIVEMSPIGPEHAITVDILTRYFSKHFSDAALVRIQNAIRLDRHSEPEPDLSLTRLRPYSTYRLALPAPEDVLLVVEVADTSLASDLQLKIPLYARAGIPEVWAIDLPHSAIHVHREPTEGSYRLIQTVRAGESLAPLAFPDRQVAVADLLG